MEGKNKIEELTEDEAKNLLLDKGLDTQDNHDILLKSLNDTNSLLLICKNPEIKLNKIPTNIVYIQPDFLKNPKSEELKSRNNEINIYIEEFKKFDKQMNDYIIKTKKSFNDLVNPSIKLRDEIINDLKKFISTVKNLCTPILNEKAGLLTINVNSLSESKSKEFLKEKREIEKIIDDFFIESNQLNLNYKKEFIPIKEEIEFINNAVANLPEPINALLEDNEKIKEKFEDIIDNMDEKKGNIHKELLGIKKSIVSSLEKKKSIILETENDSYKLKNKYDDKKIIADSLMKDIDENIKLLRSKSEQIQRSITQIREKYEQEVVELQTMNLQKIDINETIVSIDKMYEPLIKNKDDVIIDLKKKDPLKELINQTSLDLLYIMDITGSMDSYVENTKRELLNVMNAIIKDFNGIDINLGYIGYKDFEEHSKNSGIIDQKLNKDYLKIKKEIEKVDVGGGKDIAEDIQWAFERALENKFRSNARFAILACDAPCHGTKYHNEGISDYYPNGIEGRRDMEDLIEELCKKNVWLFCVKIRDDTDIMYNIFKDIYNRNNKGSKFLITELKNANDLSNKILEICKEVYIKGRFEEDKIDLEENILNNINPKIIKDGYDNIDLNK